LIAEDGLNMDVNDAYHLAKGKLKEKKKQ